MPSLALDITFSSHTNHIYDALGLGCHNGAAKLSENPFLPAVEGMETDYLFVVLYPHRLFTKLVAYRVVQCLFLAYDYLIS